MQNYYSLDLTTSQSAGPLVIDYPLMDQGDNYYREVLEPLGMYTANYTAPNIGSVAPAHVISASGMVTLYCAGDYNFSDTEAHITKFNRKYNNKPFNSFSGSISGSASGINYEYETFVYTYPGYYFELTGPTGRNPPTFTVMSRIEAKYYLIGVDVQTPDFIPITQATTYAYTTTGYTPVAASDIYLTNGGLITTSPSRGTWEYYIALSAASASQRYNVVAEATTVEKFSGNVYVAKTRYVPAL